MSEGPRPRLPDDPRTAIELLQAELAETNREVMMLTLDMDKRVEARTAELRTAHEQLERTNAELRALMTDLERRVEERTLALRRSEERYRSAAEGLVKEARRKDEFLALLGHELRNPLAPIRMAIHVLKRLGGGDQTIDRMHDMIDRQVTHLAHLVDDLLDVSRIARGKIRLQQETVDLVRLVNLTAEDHRAGIEAAGLSLSVHLPPLPACVIGDPVRLSQIVGNLLNNASKFTDRSGQVMIHLSVEGETVSLTVSDTGIGIEPETLSTLFEPFAQSERARSRSGGLGLGLALVKGLAELHHGTARAESDGPGRGARFTVTLPLATVTAAVPASTPSTPPAPAPKRILIVEDNADAATTLALYLHSTGHVIEQAGDVVTALAKARAFKPDVVLSDIALQGDRDGYDLAAALLGDGTLSRPYLIAITGFGQDADKRRAHEAGFDVHLTKPVDPQTLERVLSEISTRTE